MRERKLLTVNEEQAIAKAREYKRQSRHRPAGDRGRAVFEAIAAEQAGIAAFNTLA
jgi:Spy/CpxP family protein refolding chaperone